MRPAPSGPTASTIFFFLNDAGPTEIYTLPLHDALPILAPGPVWQRRGDPERRADVPRLQRDPGPSIVDRRPDRRPGDTRPGRGSDRDQRRRGRDDPASPSRAARPVPDPLPDPWRGPPDRCLRSPPVAPGSRPEPPLKRPPAARPSSR